MHCRIFVSVIGISALRNLAVEVGDFKTIYEFSDKYFDRLTNDVDGMYFTAVPQGRYVVDGPDYRVRELVEYAQKINEERKDRAIANLIRRLQRGLEQT